jgi:DNA-binding transcriptional MocR family regulator
MAGPKAETPIRRPEPVSGRSLYVQVAEAIEEAIRAGRLRIGDRLPAERELAQELGVSRTTVTGAYQELQARGILRGHVGRGTVIVGGPPDAAGAATLPWAQRIAPLAVQGMQATQAAPCGPDVTAFDCGLPDRSLEPVETLDALLASVVQRGGPLYSPAPASGDPALRETLAAWLGSRGIRAAAEEILVTTGGQQGLNVVARAFLTAGDVVLTEAPTYPGAIMTFRWSGADVVGVPVDHDGLRVDALEDALARYRPKLLYLIPGFNNPTGAVLSAERRRRVLELAVQYRVPIIESDLYGDLYFEREPPAALKAQDAGGVVIYQGGGSKLGLPGLRIGWLVAPVPAIAALTAAKTFEDLHTAALTQRLAAAFIGSPHVERHVARLRIECRLRRDMLVSALREHCPAVTFRVPGGSYYLWVGLPAPLTAETLLPFAREHGVSVRAGTAFSPTGGGEGHVRLCYAALPPDRIVEGARRLGRAVEQALARARAVPGPSLQVPVAVV